ncbi:homeobox protein EMX1-like [Amphiprion ocellaris]|uniref:homeobox protein EMX1-like n=1 Tax=Amphiprion ocellaris TaxID=80972 RepID=UPI002410E9F3|nr:homeobox protein EMX1-like [Amphiprion ocellaris]
MFQHGSGKKCFTIESLVGKEASGSGDEPIRPTALRFPESLHPSAAAGVFGFQGGSGRTLFSAGPDMVLQEPGTHTQGPGGLPLHPLQIPPQSFFSPQHRDALSFYPWVLRSRYLGHRFTGEPLRDVRSIYCRLFTGLFTSCFRFLQFYFSQTFKKEAGKLNEFL